MGGADTEAHIYAAESIGAVQGWGKINNWPKVGIKTITFLLIY